MADLVSEKKLDRKYEINAFSSSYTNEILRQFSEVDFVQLAIGGMLMVIIILTKISIFTKGQLISKCLFGIFNSPKKRTKNLSLLLWYIKLNCFRSFFGRIEDTKKYISKLTDRWGLKRKEWTCLIFVVSHAHFSHTSLILKAWELTKSLQLKY